MAKVKNMGDSLSSANKGNIAKRTADAVSSGAKSVGKGISGVGSSAANFGKGIVGGVADTWKSTIPEAMSYSAGEAMKIGPGETSTIRRIGRFARKAPGRHPVLTALAAALGAGGAYAALGGGAKEAAFNKFASARYILNQREKSASVLGRARQLLSSVGGQLKREGGMMGSAIKGRGIAARDAIKGRGIAARDAIKALPGKARTLPGRAYGGAAELVDDVHYGLSGIGGGAEKMDDILAIQNSLGTRYPLTATGLAGAGIGAGIGGLGYGGYQLGKGGE